jgi:hypothetical protein
VLALAGIGGCYGPERGTLFRIFRDKAFVYPLPPGWSVHEGVDELLLDDGANASANYFFSQAILASKGVTDVKSYLRYMFGLIGIKIDTVISSSSAPSKQTGTGALQHDFAQDDQKLRRVQQQLQGFAQQVERFDQALDSTDIVSDPSAGQTFEAPYSAFSASGPDGPGYYTGSPGNLHKLMVVTPY